MIQPAGYLQYGFNKFNTSDIKSIERGHILVPMGTTPNEMQAREAGERLSEIIRDSEKTDDIEFYSMLCDAAHRDYPESPAKVLTDKSGIQINATHIIGRYGDKLAVIPHTLATYEEVIENVAKSIDEPRIVDIVG